MKNQTMTSCAVTAVTAVTPNVYAALRVTAEVTACGYGGYRPVRMGGAGNRGNQNQPRRGYLETRMNPSGNRGNRGNRAKTMGSTFFPESHRRATKAIQAREVSTIKTALRRTTREQSWHHPKLRQKIF